MFRRRNGEASGVRPVAILVFAAGIAAGGATAVLAVHAVSAYGDCVDECHGGLYYGLTIGGLGVFGLLIVVVGSALLSQAGENDPEEVNRELRKLRNRPTTRG